jgi:hypothetical protein
VHSAISVALSGEPNDRRHDDRLRHDGADGFDLLDAVL